MKTKLKLGQERIHLWLGRHLKRLLEGRGFGEKRIDTFLERVEKLGLRQLRRRMVMEDFLESNSEFLREATREFIPQKDTGSELGMVTADAGVGGSHGERKPAEGDLYFMAVDVRRYITSALMLLTGDDPGLITDSLSSTGRSEILWEDIGHVFAGDILKKIVNYPPDGYSCRKFRKGFVAEPEDREAGRSGGTGDASREGHEPLELQERDLSAYLLDFAVPVLAKRANSHHEETGRLEKQVRELREDNKKLHREIKELKKRARKESRDSLRQERQLRQTRKRLKDTGSGKGSGSPDSDDGYMFG